MRNLVVLLLLLSGLMTLTSSTKSNSEDLIPPYCPGPSEIYLVKVGTGKPLYAGMDFLYPSTSYRVWAVGGPNSVVVCVTPGSGYTISGSGCQDVGEGNEYIIGVIQTSSSIAPNITINIGNTCTAGNGNWTGGYTYDAL